MNKLNRVMIIPILAIALMGSTCNDQKPVLTETQFVVVQVPNSLYNCPELKKEDFPDIDTASNETIAEFIVVALQTNKTCANSIKQIKNYLTQAQKSVKNREDLAKRIKSKI